MGELIEKQKLLPHIIQSKRQFAATIMLLLLLSFFACVSINQIGHAASFNGIYLNVEPENTEQNTQQGYIIKLLFDTAADGNQYQIGSGSKYERMGDPPVKLELYYESLCGGCREFITTKLFNTWKTLEKSGIFEVQLYPYGNAHETKTPDGQYQYKCQHGAEECTGNFIEACIMDTTNYNPKYYFPIINCMESADETVKAAPKCWEIYMSSTPFSMIEDCAKGSRGKELMHKLAQKTASLKPPHEYVPWLVINGIHTEKLEDEAFDDLKGLVCRLYTGVQPEECQKSYHKSYDPIFE